MLTVRFLLPTQIMDGPLPSHPVEAQSSFIPNPIHPMLPPATAIEMLVVDREVLAVAYCELMQKLEETKAAGDQKAETLFSVIPEHVRNTDWFKQALKLGQDNALQDIWMRTWRPFSHCGYRWVTWRLNICNLAERFTSLR